MYVARGLIVATNFAMSLTLLVGSTWAIDAQLAGRGFNLPVYANSPPGDSSRLFVLEQFAPGSLATANIQILDLNNCDASGLCATNPTPFLTITGLDTNPNDFAFQGTQGLAFHPDYANNGLFYVSLVGANEDSYVREYRVSPGDPNMADPTPVRNILTIDKNPGSRHNAAWLGFGPNDDYLYITVGDSGGENDPHQNAQNLNNLNAKVLRLDINGDDFPGDANRNYAIPPSNPYVNQSGADEIWAHGLRNLWRASFDGQTGDFYLGDVGAGAREEVNVQPAGHAGGLNYGWPLREGTIATPGVGGSLPGATDPVYSYSHGGGSTQGFSVTGGNVYRGSISEIQGHYFFADYVTERIWSWQFDGSDPSGHNGSNFTNFTDRTADLLSGGASVNQIVSFAEDGAGELYILDLNQSAAGEVYKIVPDLPPPDPVPVEGTYGNTVLASGPLAYYRFEEVSGIVLDKADDAGAPQFGPQNGTNQGATVGVAGPRAGDVLGIDTIGSAAFTSSHNSASFDGGSWVTAGAGAELDALDQGPLTVEMFFKPGSSPSNQQLAAKGTCCDTNSWFLLYLGSGTVRFGIDAGTGSGTSLDTTTSLPTAEWSHLATSYDPVSGEAQIFINGQLDVSATLTGTPPLSPADPMFIGAIDLNGSVVNHTFGEIDEVAVFDRVLPVSEVLAHFNAALANEASQNGTWIPDRSGRWNEPGNWENLLVPNDSSQAVVLGGAISVPRTVVTDTDVTVKSITFENLNEYVIFGFGNVDLEADSGNAAVTVVEGNHQFQAAVNLHSSTDVDIAAGASLTFNNALRLNGHSLTKSGNGTLTLNHAVTGGAVTLSGGVLTGRAALSGSVANDAGTLSPGNSPGVMAIRGDYIQGHDATLLLEIADIENDLLSVAGRVELAGELEVQFVGGFQPVGGVSFTLLDFASVQGEFDNVLLPDLGEGLSWDTSSLYATGTLAVVPEPSTLSLFFLALCGAKLLTASRHLCWLLV
jgi:hypothetical protein